MALESHVTANAEQQAMRLVVMATAQHPQQPLLTVQHELDELRWRRRRRRRPQRRRGRECAGPPVCPLDLHIASAARFCMFFYPVSPKLSHPPHSTQMCHPLTLTAMRIFKSFVSRASVFGRELGPPASRPPGAHSARPFNAIGTCLLN